MRSWTLALSAVVLVSRLAFGAGSGAPAPTSKGPTPPPDPSIPHALSPEADEEIRRLMKAAANLREKASDLHMQADELRDDDRRRDEERADDLDDRADDLEEKAMRYEDDADEVRRSGEKPADVKKPLL